LKRLSSNINNKMKRTQAKDMYDRTWITTNAIEILEEYENGTVTLRGLHYRLVGRGMTNTVQHYKRVVSGMIKARWDGLVAFEKFADHDRESLGITKAGVTVVEDKISEAKRQIRLWMKNYSKNRWENQEYYPEVFIEKKALIGAFQNVCELNSISLNPCKGYPSLTFLNDAKDRFQEQIDNGKECVILYFGDYDPSGEDIPRSIEENLLRLGVKVKVHRVALMKDQVLAWKLPPAPAKVGDSRTANWDGLGQVELDAVMPEKLAKLCQLAINLYFDAELHKELEAAEKEEREQYRQELKEYVED